MTRPSDYTNSPLSPVQSRFPGSDRPRVPAGEWTYQDGPVDEPIKPRFDVLGLVQVLAAINPGVTK